MPRATSPELLEMEGAIELLRSGGVPDELLDLFNNFYGAYDNARRLVGIFGVVDRASVDRAWELYTEFMTTRSAASRATRH